MEDKGFGGLSLDTVNSLKSISRNWNDDWLNGKDTTDTLDKRGNVGEDINNAIGGITSSLQVLNSAVLTPQLLTYAMTSIQSQLLSYLQSSVVEMLSFDASKIVSLAGIMVPRMLGDAGKILKDLLQTREQMQTLLIKETEAAAVEVFNGLLSEQTTKIAKAIKKKLEDVEPAIEDIAKYAQMGPAWVLNNVNNYTNRIITSGVKEITKVKVEVNDKKEKIINKLAEAMADKIAKKLNIQLIGTLKEKLDFLEEQKRQAMLKAKTLIQTAKLKIMALLGIKGG